MIAHEPRRTRTQFSPLRRAVLGALFAGVVLPNLAFAQRQNDPKNQDPTDMKIRLTFGDQGLTATLYDNPTARDLISLLPLDLTIDDYGNNEKIAYLPRKLTEEGSGPFGNEAPGDLGYYAPWGNLAFYHAGYKWSEGAIRLGRFDGNIDPLRVRGAFPLRIERIL